MCAAGSCNRQERARQPKRRMARQPTIDENALLFALLFILVLSDKRDLLSSARSHAVQEELDGSASPPFQKLRVDRDAVQGKPGGMPDQKVQEQAGSEFGVIHLDLAARGTLPKQN